MVDTQTWTLMRPEASVVAPDGSGGIRVVGFGDPLVTTVPVAHGEGRAEFADGALCSIAGDFASSRSAPDHRGDLVFHLGARRSLAQTG